MGLIAGAIAGGAALTAGAGIFGSMSSSSAAKKRQKSLEAAANIPGIDLASIYDQAYTSQRGNIDRFGDLTRDINDYNAESANLMLESSIPGFMEAQTSRVGAARRLLKGEIPDDVAALVRRTSAGKAVSGGFAGSQAGRNLEARDLGLTSLDLIGKGNSLFSNILQSTPMARTVDLNDTMLGLRDILGLRSNERAQKIAALTGAASVPSGQEVLGQGIAGLGNSLGSALITYGIANGGGGGGGTSGPNWSGVPVQPGYVTPLP